jgi:parallel beta-helix repeat protein/predicted outer membrane repeat protein
MIMITISLAWIVSTFSITLGATIHVPGDQPTIQAGIDAAVNGDTVMVADGTYTGPGNRDIDLGGKEIWVRSESIWENCIIDCQGTPVDPHRGFILESGETRNSVIIGFTIQNGYAENAGGGIRVDQSASPFISDCCIQNNTAEWGAGVYCGQDTNPRFTRCLIQNNQGISSSGGIGLNESAACFENTVIRNNTGIYSGAVGMGGSAAPSFLFCEFIDNVSLRNGGAISVGYNALPNICCCLFSGNHAEFHGGAIYVEPSASPIIGGSMAAGNTFSGNTSISGMDLCTHSYDPDDPIDATWNRFYGHCQSDYYIHPLQGFDLSDCVSYTTPINQDVYVLPTGDDQNDGLSWDTPFKTILHALEMVCSNEDSPLTIRLGKGVYSPSTTGELFTLPLVDYVNIEGSGITSTVLDAEESARMFYGHSDNHVTIRKLTIQGGRSIEGGAFFLWGSSVEFSHCKISDNYAESAGGGLYLMGGEPVFSYCKISDNTALGSGGGIYTDYDSRPVFKHCDIDNNIAQVGSGGGFSNYMFGTFTFHDCRIRNNYANQCAGGIMLGTKCVTAAITNCVINENKAMDRGGGIFSGWEVLSTIDNCLIYKNAAQSSGGGIYLLDDAPTYIQNCTITDNMASDGGGIYCLQQIYLEISDSILWNDTPNEIGGDLHYTHVNYTDIQGGFSGVGNIDAAPLFFTGPEGGFYLSQTASGQPGDSPCLDAGSDLSETVCFVIPDGQICMNEVTTRTDEMEDTGQVDMGYHYLPYVPSATPTQTMVPTMTRTPMPPTATPPPSPTDVPTATPSNIPTDVPTDPPSTTPTNTPAASFTPTPIPPTSTPSEECSDLGVELRMPSHYFKQGDVCGCDMYLCNPEQITHSDIPLFVILEVNGEYLFAPSFTENDHYIILELLPGLTPMEIIPEFAFPEGAGSATGITWYAGMTNSSMTELFGKMDSWEFGWGE